jgi:flagellar P-ring protein precursor FlgI
MAVRIAAAIWLMLGLLVWPSHRSALAQSGAPSSDPRIRDLCRLKGQEENTLQGLGIVVGLKGTGDGGARPTGAALARLIQKMGGQIPVDAYGKLQTKDVEDAKNVALVFVSVTVPPNGSQQGDKLDCSISAISAKSLDGGTLLLTPLLGPRPDRPVVYGLAQGNLKMEDLRVPTSARIEGGCKIEQSITNHFTHGETLTLILDPDHCSFSVAQSVADAINGFHNAQHSSFGSGAALNSEPHLAIAKDQVQVLVKIPSHYRENPVPWVAQIMELPLINLQAKKRVVIQERQGVVVIGEEVTIAPLAISHKNLTISAKPAGNASVSFVGVSSPGEADKRPKLKNLVDSLNVLAVPTEDIIAIIKAIKRQGNLYGELVIE